MSFNFEWPGRRCYFLGTWRLCCYLCVSQSVGTTVSLGRSELTEKHSVFIPLHCCSFYYSGTNAIIILFVPAGYPNLVETQTLTENVFCILWSWRFPVQFHNCYLKQCRCKFCLCGLRNFRWMAFQKFFLFQLFNSIECQFFGSPKASEV